MAKAKCPVTREEFAREAQPIVLTGTYMGREVKIELTPIVPDDKSKSFGWFSGEVRGTLPVGDAEVPIFAGANFWCTGSKEKA